MLSRSRAAAIVTLVLVIGADLLSMAADSERLRLVNKVLADPTSVTLPTLNASDDRVVRSGWILLVTAALCAAAFITWMYQAAKRAQELRQDALRHSRGWAVGGWFVPFLNLVRPPQMVNDIWASARPIDQVKRGTPLVGWWWGTLIVSGVFARVGMTGSEDSLTSLRDATRVDLAGSVVDIAAAALAIAVVWKVTERIGRATPISYAPPAEVAPGPEPASG